MEFGPLEYAILGNGALLVLLFFVLLYTLFKLREASIRKRREKELAEQKEASETLDVFSPDAKHQNFSTLCGINYQPQFQERHGWSTLPSKPLKKCVRIDDTAKGSTDKISNTLEFPPCTFAQPSIWMTLQSPAATPFFPGSYATLNIPVNKKGKIHKCQRTQSFRIPAIITPQPLIHHPAMPSNLYNKRINVDLGKY